VRRQPSPADLFARLPFSGYDATCANPLQSKVIPWPCRGRSYCHALFDGKRMLDIAVEPKSVRFEIGTV